MACYPVSKRWGGDVLSRAFLCSAGADASIIARMASVQLRPCSAAVLPSCQAERTIRDLLHTHRTAPALWPRALTPAPNLSAPCPPLRPGACPRRPPSRCLPPTSAPSSASAAAQGAGRCAAVIRARQQGGARRSVRPHLVDRIRVRPRLQQRRDAARSPGVGGLHQRRAVAVARVAPVAVQRSFRPAQQRFQRLHVALVARIPQLFLRQSKVTSQSTNQQITIFISNALPQCAPLQCQSIVPRSQHPPSS